MRKERGNGEGGRMANERMGICMVCGRAGKMYSCAIGGELVCELHYDFESGLCVVHKRGRGLGRL